MALQDMLKTIAERVQSTASVKTAYGDPVTVEGKTIIPVAKVRYGFGGGGGSGTGVHGEQADGHPGEQTGAGGGGGGGLQVTPVGIIEITPGETRYISFEDRRRMIRAGLIVGVLALLMLRRRLRGGR